MSGTYQHQVEYRKKLKLQPIPEGQKRCTRCLKLKEHAEFENKSGRTPGGISKYCHGCRRYSSEFLKAQRASRTAEERQVVLDRAKVLRDGRKALVIAHYGGKCACCGVPDLEFLTMDHKEKIGSKKRKENGEWGNRFYLTIIKRGFPDHLRCLCWNCNWAYGCYGECPHQKVTNEHNQERLATPAGYSERTP